MKTVIPFLALICSSSLLLAQSSKSPVDSVVILNKQVHDFGKIIQGKPVHCEFVFMNISKTPVTIENAMSSCGCVTVSWSTYPIMPGKADKLSVGFNAAATGTFDKKIYFKLQGIDEMKTLSITGQVISNN